MTETSQSLSRLLPPLWAIPILFLLSVGTVWLRLWIVKTTYSVHHINTELKSIEDQKEALLVRSSALKSPERLERLAKEQGLLKPQLNQIIHLQGDAKKGVSQD